MSSTGIRGGTKDRNGTAVPADEDRCVDSLSLPLPFSPSLFLPHMPPSLALDVCVLLRFSGGRGLIPIRIFDFRFSIFLFVT